MRKLPTKYTAILIVTFGICIAYGWSYLHFRQNKTIVHYYTTGYGHTIEARLPDAPQIFTLSALNGFDTSEVLLAHIRRVELLNLLYLPLRKLEEFYWWITSGFEWI